MKTCITVVGREPIPGEAKTRLVPALGPERAASVYAVMLEHTLSEALATGAPVFLDLAEERRGEWPPPPGVHVGIQRPGDIGCRMASAFAARFTAGLDAVILVGSDIPLLGRGVLSAAIAALDRTPVVLGPATDGGYYLVGQRAPGHDLFEGIPWSSSDTLDATRRRLELLDIRHEEVEWLSDVDTPRDLREALRDPRLPADVRRAMHITMLGDH